MKKNSFFIAIMALLLCFALFNCNRPSPPRHLFHFLLFKWKVEVPSEKIAEMDTLWASLTHKIEGFGCIELIIHLTADHCQLSREEGKWSVSPAFTLLGIYDKPYEVVFTQNVQVFGIRFYPDGINHIFGIPPAVFFATYEDGTDVLGRQMKAFCEKIRSLDTMEQVQITDAFLKSQLAKNQRPYDHTHAAMTYIRNAKGMTDYQALNRLIPISPRQLQREFKTIYGITITDYMRLSRLNAIQRYMQSQPQSLTWLSYELNFSDQSHFIREFKTFAGVAPGKFIKNRAHFIVNPVVPITDN